MNLHQNPMSAQEAGRKMKMQRAVDLREKGQQGKLPFPMLYGFVPYPWNVSMPSGDGNEFYVVTSANAEGPDGLSVAASGGVITIPLAIRKDHIFHLLAIKYSAWNPNLEPGDLTRGSRDILVNPSTALQSGNTLMQPTENQRVPWTSFLDVSVYINTGRDLYGGTQVNAQTQAKMEQPLPIHALQGREDGVGRMRLAAQLPPQGLITIKVTNNWNQSLRVNGHAFGYAIP